MKKALCFLLLALLFTATQATASTYEIRQNPPSTQTQNSDVDTVLLSFVGDCSIGDDVRVRKYSNSLTNKINENGYDWPFSTVSEYFHQDDVTFVNLEVVFTERYKLKSDKVFNLIGDPAFVQVLTGSGVDAVSTVNNHCRDFSFVGHKDTIKTLDDAGLMHFGTVYPNTKFSTDILGIYETKGIKIGVFGFSYPKSNDMKHIKSRIEALRNDYGCDLIVASMHWGREERLTSEAWQFNLAKDIIDAGADIIWGHHPHVLQPVYFYKGKPIMFSTGNFVFGTISSLNPNTGIFQLKYDTSTGTPSLKNFSVVPCQTTRKVDYRPRVLTDAQEKKECFNILVGKRNVKDFVTLPESFLTDGYVTFEDE